VANAGQGRFLPMLESQTDPITGLMSVCLRMCTGGDIRW